MDGLFILMWGGNVDLVEGLGWEEGGEGGVRGSELRRGKIWKLGS
jgi:hypothetical protein